MIFKIRVTTKFIGEVTWRHVRGRSPRSCVREHIWGVQLKTQLVFVREGGQHAPGYCRVDSNGGTSVPRLAVCLGRRTD